MSDPHNTRAIPLGTPVCAYDGTQLGTVREVQPHYLRVGVEGEHNDLEIPVHSILGFEDGVLRVSVKRSSVTEVDNVETAHRMGEKLTGYWLLAHVEWREVMFLRPRAVWRAVCPGSFRPCRWMAGLAWVDIRAQGA